MRFVPTRIPDVILIEPIVHGDDRGFFLETWRESLFEGLGLEAHFVQDNHSRSVRHTLRGLHYQLKKPQGKLLRAVSGSVFDVAVDLRRSSQSFGHWVGVELSAENHHQLWVPPGFAHGFLVTSGYAEITYKCTEYYAPDDEHTLLWNDPQTGVHWPLPDGVQPLLSAKDRVGKQLAEAEVYP